MRQLSFLCVSVICLSLGCGPVKPTPSKEVSYVSPDELCRTYRANPKDRTYADRLVQVVLEPRQYRLRAGCIEAHWYAENLPGCLQFECPSCPTDDTKRLVVTGRVAGIVRDGVRREATTDFYVRVTSCSVTVLEP